MSKLPPSLNIQKSERSVCLILEGFEEDYYFRRLITFPIFSSIYSIKPINAKSASNIPAKYQEALASDNYSIVLVVCDMDRTPEAYNNILLGIEDILGSGNAEKVITFTRPCTLQIILSHFGEVKLTTQAKAAAREDVERLTGVQHYDAHQDQLNTICQKIFLRSWGEFQERLKLLSTDPNDIPSSNICLLFDRLCSDNSKWIDDLNASILT